MGTAPDARILRWGYQHVGILEPTQTLKFAIPATPTPDASQWNIGVVGSSGIGHVYFMYMSCIFHVVCASFSALATRKLADAKADSSGIWAYRLTYMAKAHRALVGIVANGCIYYFYYPTIHVYTIIYFSHFDKREVLQEDYSQLPLLDRLFSLPVGSK